MNIVVWILQILLALLFLNSGYSKTFQYSKKEAELKQMDHLESGNLIKFIGTMEILGALGLILPKALNILPFLTMWAAIGLSIVMLGAMFTHLRFKEYQNFIFTTVILILLIIIAVFRA
ncbi:MAG TPA: DoxX family protein [Tetragenococcus sp.]|nr:DoxX family protein [Tetragenococcus sp.]